MTRSDWTVRALVLAGHQWAGLGTSVVLAIAGLTGAVLLWPGTSIVRRASGRLHDTLALGSMGAWVVLLASAAAVGLQMSGVYLWWRQKRLTVRLASGRRHAACDLHHAAGIACVLVMFILAASAVGRPLTRALGVAPADPVRRMVARLHTGEGFATPIKVVYAVGSLGFVVQGVTGVVMWWRPARRERHARPGEI